jgi:hypothetical protein
LHPFIVFDLKNADAMGERIRRIGQMETDFFLFQVVNSKKN